MYLYVYIVAPYREDSAMVMSVCDFEVYHIAADVSVLVVCTNKFHDMCYRS